jgi:hypothetical protein
MKPLTAAPILTAIAIASFASVALLAPTDHANARSGGNARAAMTQTKINTGLHHDVAARLYCTGPGCPNAKATGVRATTTGTLQQCLPGSGGRCRKPPR